MQHVSDGETILLALSTIFHRAPKQFFHRKNDPVPPPNDNIHVAPGRVPDDDLELELDPQASPPASTQSAHVQETAQVSSAETVRPWHKDENYITLREMRDEMRNLAKSKARIEPKDRIAAARAAITASNNLIDWFGVETGESESAAEQAAARAGTEVARRAVNTGMFGAATPHAPQPWVSAPGDPNPHRAQSDDHAGSADHAETD